MSKRGGGLARQMGVGQVDFGEFYAATRDGVLSAVRVSVRRREDADDAVSEAYARALARWPSVSKHANPTAWVARTALNVNVSRWRRERWEAPLDGVDAPDGYVGPTPDPDVLHAVLALPRRQREVVALRIVLDLDAATTGRVLGIAPATVGVHLHRALSTLQDTLRLEANR